MAPKWREGYYVLPRALVAWSRLFAVVVCCFLFSRLALSEPVPVWAVFTQENSDLPSDRVLALALGADGSLWAGTDGGGLARLDKDGHWQIYSTVSTQGGLPSNRVLALTLGADGSLWAGTDGGGLARLDKDGHWRTYSKGSTNGGLPNDTVRGLALDPEGALWIGTGGGLARLDNDGHWQTYSQANTKGGLLNDNINALALGPDGALWVGTDYDLARLDRDGHWQTYSKENTNLGLPNATVLALTLGPDGVLWVGTRGGLARLDKDGHWQTYTQASTKGDLPNDNVEALAHGPDGALWVGTGSGLARLDKDGHWQNYTQASTKGDLPNDYVSALALGPDGALWVGTVGGLARLDGHWQTYSQVNTKGGLPNDSVAALALGPDGALWVGTYGGLARLDKDAHWQTYSKANTKGDLPNNAVLALAPGSHGALWVGTGGGLARLDKDSHWQTYNEANTKGGLPDDRVTRLVLGRGGALWVGTVGGLARLDKDGHWQTYTKANTNGSLPSDNVDALAYGPDGALWVGTGGGLARLDKDGHWQTYGNANTKGGLLNDNVNALALGPDGALWVGTYGGLARLDKDGHWQTYGQASTNGGLPTDHIYTLALGRGGALWVGTVGGLTRLDKEGRWQTYNKANTNGGVPNDQVMGLAHAPDGALWVGTVGGLGHFNRPLGQTLRIVDVIGGKVDGVTELTEPEQTVAVVAFDGSYLTQPEMFRYVWRVDKVGTFGASTGQEITTRSPFYRVLFLGDGTYQLRVIAVDRYGDRSEPKDIDYKVVLPKPKTLLDTLVSAWPVVLTAVIGLYALAFIALLTLARRRAWALRMVSDSAWGRWLTWPFFFLRHLPAVQRWVLELWFQAMRQSTSAEIQFLDPPVSICSRSRSEGTALLQRLGASPRVWLHGRSGMGKSSVFAAWERAYFVADDVPNLNAAVRRYGFILVTLPVRHYAALPVPDANRPESWVLEAVRRQFEQHDFATRDLGLIEALLRTGHIAVALDGTNEADRDLALAAFASQFRQARLLVTSQAIPSGLASDERWEIWELPDDIAGLRDGLLALWLGDEKGEILSRRIVAEGLSGTVVSGYDLRLLADLAAVDPERAELPTGRVALYRAMLARVYGPEGGPLRLEGLKQIAWNMVTQRRRRIVADDEKTLGVGTLPALEREGLRIVRSIGAEHEFRHDQMRAFLAAQWLVEETPTIPALQKAATNAGAFALNRRDQEELWQFVALLLTANADVEALWHFASDDPIDRGILLAFLQAEADKRGVTLVRVAQTHESETTAV